MYLVLWSFDDSYGYETWVDDLERLFSYYNMMDVQIYLYAKCRFKAEVENWCWRNHARIHSCTRLKVFLRNRYSCHPKVSHSSRRYCDHPLQLRSPKQPTRPLQLPRLFCWHDLLTTHKAIFIQRTPTRDTCNYQEQKLDMEPVMLSHKTVSTPRGGVNRCKANLMTNNAELKTNYNTLSVTKECSRIPGEGLWTISSKFL